MNSAAAPGILDFGTLAGIAGIIIGIAGIIAAYIFYRQGLRSKEPRWAIRTNNLVRGKSPFLHDLEISYRGQRVETLSVSRLMFWNGGKETIRKSDLDTRDHLRIQGTNDTKLLDAKLLGSNTAASELYMAVSPDNESIILDFDYLDYNDGFVIQIIHNGQSSQDLCVAGAIIGANSVSRKTILPSMQELSKYTTLRVPGRAYTLALVIVPIVGIGLLTLGVGILEFEPIRNFVQLTSTAQDSLDPRFTGAGIALLGLLYLAGPIRLRIRLLSSRPPKGLDVFLENS